MIKPMNGENGQSKVSVPACLFVSLPPSLFLSAAIHKSTPNFQVRFKYINLEDCRSIYHTDSVFGPSPCSCTHKDLPLGYANIHITCFKHLCSDLLLFYI